MRDLISAYQFAYQFYNYHHIYRSKLQYEPIRSFTSPISALPLEICKEIWKYLDLNTLTKVILVNKSWQIFSVPYLIMLKQSKVPLLYFKNSFPVEYSKKEKKFQVSVLIPDLSKPLPIQVNHLKENFIVFVFEKGKKFPKKKMGKKSEIF